jgi:hypothetical protein
MIGKSIMEFRFGRRRRCPRASAGVSGVLCLAVGRPGSSIWPGPGFDPVRHDPPLAGLQALPKE